MRFTKLAANRRGAWLPFALVCLIAVALLPLLAGCAAGQGHEVNLVAMSPRTSYSDESSRSLAARTFAKFKSQYEDYRVGPLDVLEVSVFEWIARNETHTESVRVAESGVISLPVVGLLPVTGLTIQDIQVLLEKRFTDGGILRNPRVSVAVKDYRSKVVAVVGSVNEPGLYTLRRNVTTLLSVLSLAGGVNDQAGQVLYVVRTPADAGPAEAAAESGKDNVIAVDLFELLEKGDLSLNVVLENGDVVNVPKAEEFSVLGFVRRPGRFPLNKPITVLEAVALAGGLREREASPSACVLKRRSGQSEAIIPLDLVAISHGEGPNIYLAPNDVIEVRQTFVKKVTMEVFEAALRLFSIGYSLNN